MARRRPAYGIARNDSDDADSKSARTRQRILDAAATVLSRNGYSGTKLSDVADVAGIQAPALYYYFDSRDELVEEVVRTGTRLTLEFAQKALAALPDSASCMTRIVAVMEAHLRIALEMSDYATAGIRNSGQLPPEMRARQREQEREYGHLWVGLFRAAHESGEIRPDVDPEVAAMLIIGTLNWAPEWWNPRRGSLESLISTAEALITGGLGGQAQHTGS